MLSSAETKIHPAHKCLNATIVDILTFTSWINYRLSEISTNFCYFSNYEQFKLPRDLVYKVCDLTITPHRLTACMKIKCDALDKNYNSRPLPLDSYTTPLSHHAHLFKVIQ